MTPSNVPLVVVTGASGGIGLATVRAFAASGWRVLAGSRSPEALTSEGRVQAIRLDPCDADQRAALVELLARAYGGRLDCLVNNAGYAQSGPVELLDEAAWSDQLRVNTVAPALLVGALLPALRAAGGCVINVSSILGRTGLAWQGAYCASKFALEGWSESLALETQGQGVRVHLIEPGSTRSEFGRKMRRLDVLSEYYRTAGSRFAAWRERLAASAQSPESVAHVIVRTAQTPGAPFRRLVGRDARVVGSLLRFLPANAYFALASALARRQLALQRRSR